MRLRAPITITDSIHQIRAVGAKVTVLQSSEGVLLVDAGARGSKRAIVGGLESLALSPEDIRLIAVTHYHPDHSGGLGEMLEVSSSEVAAHTVEIDIISGRRTAPDAHRNRFLAKVASPIVSRMYGSPVDVAHPLEDGQLLPFPDRVQAVHAPGHTAGSLCFLVPSAGTLIVGDSLQNRFGKLGPPARSVTADPEQALDSLARLLELDFDTMCFSHFSPLRGGAKDALRDMLARVRP